MSESTIEQVQDKVKEQEVEARKLDDKHRKDYTVAYVATKYETDEALAEYQLVIANETRLLRIATENQVKVLERIATALEAEPKVELAEAPKCTYIHCDRTARIGIVASPKGVREIQLCDEHLEEQEKELPEIKPATSLKDGPCNVLYCTDIAEWVPAVSMWLCPNHLDKVIMHRAQVRQTNE